MYLLQSWVESLRLFLPKNAWLFSLVTLRAYYLAMKDIYKALLGVFCALIVLLISLDVWQFYSMQAHTPWYIVYSVLFIRIFLVLLLFLIVRPSIPLKNKLYYLHYSWYSVYVCLVLGLNALGSWLIYTYLPSSALWVFYALTTGRMGASSLVLLILFISPLLVFIILFILDSDGSIPSFAKALVRGTAMFVYNYPFCLISFALFYGYTLMVTHLYTAGVAFLASFDMSSIYSLVAIISLHQFVFVTLLVVGGLLPLVWITNFYIKRVHEQYTLYK